MAQVAYPLINGVRYDYSSIEIKFNGNTYRGVKEVAYNETLEPSKVYGTSAEILGATRGVYDCSGSVTMYKSDARALREALVGAGQNGWGEKAFDIVVTFSANGEAVQTDQLIGVRLKGRDASHSQGPDALEEKYDLHIMKIISDGQQMISNPLA